MRRKDVVAEIDVYPTSDPHLLFVLMVLEGRVEVSLFAQATDDDADVDTSLRTSIVSFPPEDTRLDYELLQAVPFIIKVVALEENTRYMVYTAQPSKELSLIIFFVVFFSSFFMCLSLVTAGWRLQVNRVIAHRRRQRIANAIKMAQRPMGVVVLNRNEVVPSPNHQYSANVIVKPTSIEPLRHDPHYGVTSYMVSLPIEDDAQQPSIQFATALLRNKEPLDLAEPPEKKPSWRERMRNKLRWRKDD